MRSAACPSLGILHAGRAYYTLDGRITRWTDATPIQLIDNYSKLFTNGFTNVVGQPAFGLQ